MSKRLPRHWRQEGGRAGNFYRCDHEYAYSLSTIEYLEKHFPLQACKCTSEEILKWEIQEALHDQEEA